MKYQMVLEKYAEGFFVARCLSLPECVAHGATADEAVAHIKEGMTAYLQSLAKQELMKCSVPGCEIEPLFHCTGVESRSILFEKAFCERHSQAFVTDFRSSLAVGPGMPRMTPGVTCVDFEMILYYTASPYTATSGRVFLHEVGGTRRVSMLVDGWAWFSLVTHLKPHRAPRPRAQAAWTAIIAELRGELQDVTLDRRAGEEPWSASARFLQSGRLASVDLRAGDACVLALVGDAPILVVEEALERFADRGEGLSGD